MDGRKPLRRKRGEEERKEAEEWTASHLVVDVKHSLLDLLVDFLGCVDECLRWRQNTFIYLFTHAG